MPADRNFNLELLKSYTYEQWTIYLKTQPYWFRASTCFSETENSTASNRSVMPLAETLTS